MHEVKRQIDGLQPTLRPFFGKLAIPHVTFLSILRESFDMIVASEAAVVWELTYFL